MRTGPPACPCNASPLPNKRPPRRLGVTALALGGVPIRYAWASVAVNIRPLSEAAAKIGSTIRASARMVCLLFATANSVRICNITALVEFASAKRGTVVAKFAIGKLALW